LFVGIHKEGKNQSGFLSQTASDAQAVAAVAIVWCASVLPRDGAVYVIVVPAATSEAADAVVGGIKIPAPLQHITAHFEKPKFIS
jgi:hypothetical protein